MTTTTDDVARALRLVVRDLESADVPAPAVTWVEEWMTLGFPDGSVHGTDLSQATQQAEVLERMADMVHEWVVEEMWSWGRPSNWPRCGAHPDSHPMWVARIGSEVVWACPTGDAPPIPVGSLPER
jgi:hypothetical protein